MPKGEELQSGDHGEVRKCVPVDKRAQRRGAEIEAGEGTGRKEESGPGQEDYGHKEGAEQVREGASEDGNMIYIEYVCV